MKLYGVPALKYSAETPKAASVRRLGSVAGQMLLSPGAQMIWEFEEVAADYEQGSDLEKLRAIAPMWNYFDNDVRGSLAEVYKQLCNLRLKNSDMFDGSAQYTGNGFSNSVSTPRWIRLNNGTKEILGVFNTAVSGQAATVSVPVQQLSGSNYQLITAGYNDNVTITGNGQVQVTLLPNSFAVFATPNVSGIEDVESDISEAAVNVYGVEGEIIISGDYNTAEVYNLQGAAMGSLRVPAGIYVVHIDGVAHKVFVR